ncbi:hypothetical protein YC2023_017859 [Brassica napus]
MSSCFFTNTRRYWSKFGAFFNQRKSFAFYVPTKEPKILIELVISILIYAAGEACRLDPPVKLNVSSPMSTRRSSRLVLREGDQKVDDFTRLWSTIAVVAGEIEPEESSGRRRSHDRRRL